MVQEDLFLQLFRAVTIQEDDRPGPMCRLPLWPQCKTRRGREATPEGDSSRKLVRVDGSNRLRL